MNKADHVRVWHCSQDGGSGWPGGTVRYFLGNRIDFAMIGNVRSLPSGRIWYGLVEIQLWMYFSLL